MTASYNLLGGQSIFSCFTGDWNQVFFTGRQTFAAVIGNNNCPCFTESPTISRCFCGDRTGILTYPRSLWAAAGLSDLACRQKGCWFKTTSAAEVSSHRSASSLWPHLTKCSILRKSLIKRVFFWTLSLDRGHKEKIKDYPQTEHTVLSFSHSDCVIFFYLWLA